MMSREARQTRRRYSKGLSSPQAVMQRLPRQRINRLCDEIAREFHPDKIILFGSYAYGSPRPESDVDLLIVMEFEGSPFRQAALILRHVINAVGIMPLDLIVRTTKQVQERIRIGDSFVKEIIERGRVVYEADHS